jgi:hypothetical protein
MQQPQGVHNHKVFTRRVIKHTDRGASVDKQTFTISATPSDVRAYANALTQKDVDIVKRQARTVDEDKERMER